MGKGKHPKAKSAIGGAEEHGADGRAAFLILLLSFPTTQPSTLLNGPWVSHVPTSPSLAVRVTPDGSRPVGGQQQALGGTSGSSSRGGRTGLPSSLLPPPLPAGIQALS